MPTYDYRCLDCRAEFEATHAITAALPKCTACGGKVQRIVLSPPAVHGSMVRGRDLAARSLPECGKGCRCCP